MSISRSRYGNRDQPADARDHRLDQPRHHTAGAPGPSRDHTDHAADEQCRNQEHEDNEEHEQENPPTIPLGEHETLLNGGKRIIDRPVGNDRRNDRKSAPEIGRKAEKTQQPEGYQRYPAAAADGDTGQKQQKNSQRERDEQDDLHSDHRRNHPEREHQRIADTRAGPRQPQAQHADAADSADHADQQLIRQYLAHRLAKNGHDLIHRGTRRGLDRDGTEPAEHEVRKENEHRSDRRGQGQVRSQQDYTVVPCRTHVEFCH